MDFPSSSALREERGFMQLNLGNEGGFLTFGKGHDQPG